MRELTIRLSALAPEAANALHVVAYFDRLVEHRAGYRSVLRGAAILSGCPAGFVDRSRGDRLRVLPEGTYTTPDSTLADVWPRAVAGDGSLEMWLERDEPVDGSLDALVLERALLAAAAMLGRTLDTPEQRRAEWVRALLADDSDDAARDTALRGLELTATTPLCVVAMDDGPLLARSLDDAREAIGTGRAGIGPIVPARASATSWARARLARMLTAEGTQQDPGDRVIIAEESDTLLVLAAGVRPDEPPPADVVALDDAAATTPWMLETLHAISTTNSVRDAAGLLHLHHSTVQERAARADRVLGWNVLSQRGKQRTQLALVLRRIRAAPRA